MARPNYGPQAHKRARQLLEGLLAYANDDLELDEDNTSTLLNRLRPCIQFQWRSNQQLVIRTKVRFLEELIALTGSKSINSDHIKEALKRFEDHVGILEDNRAASQGSDTWHFTLNLWYPRFEVEKNLRHFDLVWEQARPKKSQEVAGILYNATTDIEPELRPKAVCSWGEAPDVANVYGRVEEINTIEQWILQERCRLIALLGMGGIGKTVLSVNLVQRLQAHFDYVIWRSLRNAPPIQELLTDLLLTLSRQQVSVLPMTIHGSIAALIKYLQEVRCFLVLDNFESLLQSEQTSGQYRPDYAEYGYLLRSIGDSTHDSCLLLTSREKPIGLSAKEGAQLPIRSFQLAGVDQATAKHILLDKGLNLSTSASLQLLQHYSGNPLALKIAGTTLLEVFDGNLDAFLAARTVTFGDISDLLHQQCSRLSSLEKQVMQWIALSRAGVTVSELQQNLVPIVPIRELVLTVESLQRRSLIERSSGSFTQLPVVMEYITEELIDAAVSEILNGQINLLGKLPLMVAQTKDYIRQTQERLILQPIAERVRSHLGSFEAIQPVCQHLLNQLKAQPPCQPGYGAGNLINLMTYLKMDLRGLDFSNLAIWQVSLQDLRLPQVDFSGADLSRSVFAKTIGGFLAIACSLNGQRLATAISNEIVVWDLGQKQQLFACQGHSAWVLRLVYSPTQPILASSSSDQTIRLWNAETGQCLRTLTGHDSWIQALTFSPDGCQLASGSNDATIYIWDTQTGQLQQCLMGHSSRILALCWQSDGRALISSSQDQTVRVWDTVTADCLKVWPIHVNWTMAMDLSPDGHTLVTGSDEKAVKFWRLETGECISTLPNYESHVWSVTFSPKGDQIATGSEDETLKIWNVNTGECLQTLVGHRQRVWQVTYSPDGQSLISVGDDQNVRIWQVASSQCLQTLKTHSNWLQAVAFSPNGEVLASSGEDHLIRLWHSASETCLKTLHGHRNQVPAVVFSPQGDQLASVSDDQTLRLWDIVSGECLRILQGHTGWVQSVAFSPCGRYLASASHDRTVRIWDSLSGECLQCLEGHIHRVKAVAFDPTGIWLASASDDQTLKLWEMDSGVCLRTLVGHSDWVSSLAFHSEEPLLASGSCDRTIKFWNPMTGDCILTLEGHIRRVRAVTFSPNGQFLASCGDDCTVRLWDVASGQCQRIFEGHSRTVSSVAFAPDGSTLASCSEDETIRLWHLETGIGSKILRPERPYEGMNISGTVGLTPAQRNTLKALGAVEQVNTLILE